MEFRILGPLEVLDDGDVITVAGRKQRTLLAVLLLNANRVVSIDSLIDALWGESPPSTAGKAIQVYVSQLRRILGKGHLQTKTPGYVFKVESNELDLHRFEELLDQAKDPSCEAPAETLRSALALWRGPVLEEFAYESFARLELARIDELRLTCLEERIENDLTGGRHAEIIGDLEALVAEHPLRERLRGLLMLALYRSGRQAEALEVYQETRRILVDELGIEPGSRCGTSRKRSSGRIRRLISSPCRPKYRRARTRQGASSWAATPSSPSWSQASMRPLAAAGDCSSSPVSRE